MGKWYWLAAGSGVVAIFLTIFLHYYIHSFLSGSGVLPMDSSLIFENLGVLFFLVTLVSSMFVFSNRSNRIVLTLYATISCATAFVLLYFGLHLTINPSVYFSDLYPEWKENVDTEVTEIIQNKYKCCGFYKVTEVPKDECVFKKPNSCFFSMSKNLGPQMKSIGLFWLSSAALLVISASFLVVELSQIEEEIDGSIPL